MRVFLAGLFQDPNGKVEQTQGVSGLGHFHLRGHVPRIVSQDLLAVFEHLQVIPGSPGALHPGARGPRPHAGQDRAPHVVLVLGFFGAAKGLAIDEVGRVQLAATEQELDAVVEVAGGDDLVGALVLTGRGAAVLGG